MPSSDPLAVLLSIGFLAVLYLFLAWVVRSSLRDLRRADEPEPVARSASADGGGRGVADFGSAIDARLEVVAAKGYRPGTALGLGDGVTLGRSDGADIRIDDPFASSSHARIFQRGEFMYIEDMGSTNGTYLNGRQIGRAEQLKAADTVRIGDTEFRYEE